MFKLKQQSWKCNYVLILVRINHFIIFISVTQTQNSLAEGCNSVGETEVRSLNSKYLSIDKFSNDSFDYLNSLRHYAIIRLSVMILCVGENATWYYIAYTRLYNDMSMHLLHLYILYCCGVGIFLRYIIFYVRGVGYGLIEKCQIKSIW